MPSAWITHVKQYAKTHNITYKDALKKAGSTFKKSKWKYLNILFLV